MDVAVISDFEFPGLAEAIAQACPGARLVKPEPVMAPAQSLPGSVMLAMPVGGPRLAALLAAAPGLRWLHVFGTGVDGFPRPRLPATSLMPRHSGR